MKSIKTIVAVIAFSVLLSALDATKGTVAGAVLDGQTGQPIRQVKISIDGMTMASLVTDLEGRFKFELSPGKYKLRFSSDNYLETTIDEVEVKAGEVTEASTVMTNKATVTKVEVVEKVGAVEATAEAKLTERKLAATVSDTISSEEIGKSTASDAAGALEKVTGVSVMDNGFVYVRGLGERYSATMLNNAMIPTTEPEKRVVPLDLFPAALIDSIQVLKTYTPDLPGEFSAGLVQLKTVEFPNQKSFNYSFSSGFNSRTSFRSFDTYRGGSFDFFGFDDGARDLPASVPTDDRLFAGRYTPQELQQIGRTFDVNYESIPVGDMRPSLTHNFVGGSTWGKLGFVGALTLSNSPQYFDESVTYYRNAGGGKPTPFNEYPDFNSYMEGSRLGGVANLAYQFNPANKLVVRNTFTNDSDKEARVFRGYNRDLDAEIQDERLRWIQRSMFSTQIEGDHLVQKLKGSIFTWQFSTAKAKRDEPDLRQVIRGKREDGRYAFLNISESGFRFYNKLDDTIYEPAGAWGLPFYKGSVGGILKLGFKATMRERNFQARRFRWFGVNLSTVNVYAPSNTLFGSENIRPNGFELREETRGTDRYVGDMDVYSGFAMVDLNLTARLRLIGGLRVEDAQINVLTRDPYIPTAQPVFSSLNNRDPLPGFNLIYALTSRQNVRGGYSRTVSRPDFRELSPFDFTNVSGGFTTIGNPNLLRAAIDNYDIRWEWFPGGNQVLAASYFYKRFSNPIETFIEPTVALRQSFLNAEKADNQGFELEFRRNLGFVNPALRELSAQANFTFVDSEVTIPDSKANVLTSLVRPMMGQSRYIYNFAVEWNKPRWRSSTRFFVNSVSRRISDVGSFGLPDIYQERNTLLDFVYQYSITESGKYTLRFNAENLTDNEYHWTQGGLPFRTFRLGRTYTVGTSISFF
jgi:outer membrane receptor protein involved in Fe transport